LSVRINALDTPFAYKDLTEVAEKCGSIISSVVLPKVNSAGDVHFADRLLDGISMNLGFKNSIGLEPSIETAEGMENISLIASASRRNIALIFGIADYSASIGARLISISGHGEKEEDIYPGYRWNYVISRMVTAAKANNLMAIDAAYGNFKDSEGLRKSAAIGCALGCDGKWAIHPSQTDIINEVFSPSREDIERALKIIEAHKEAVRDGRGAVSLDGRMIDHATIRMARNLTEQAKHLHML
jgi:citrate lyase beta subunit